MDVWRRATCETSPQNESACVDIKALATPAENLSATLFAGGPSKSTGTWSCRKALDAGVWISRLQRCKKSSSLNSSSGFGQDFSSLSRRRASAVEDCVEPTHEQLSPYQHSQVHFFAPQTSGGHLQSSSYLSATGEHHEHYQQSQPEVAHAVSSGSSGSEHYQYQQHHQQGNHQQHQHESHQQVFEHKLHQPVEPQIEYFTNVHQHHVQQSHKQQQQQQQYHQHETPVHYVQQPVVKEEVHKHVYVHVAPEEKEEIHQKVILPTYTKQKHYKIIFIKAPSPPTLSKVVLPQQPVNEEKTLVYVLHKKPELEQEIVVPPQVTSKPSKPEVYFIKYKTKKQEQQSYQHEEQHSSSALYGGSSTISSNEGYEAADLSGYSGSFSNSFSQPIIVTEGSYHHHSTTQVPIKLTTVHSVPSSSLATPASSYVSSTASSAAGHKSQSIKVTNIGLSGYSSGGTGLASAVTSSTSTVGFGET
uniref:DUF243 domain-containing protein n=1 Tax=Anopheles farauti TaxID=69004 RepID=A0A182QP68_9DIPT